MNNYSYNRDYTAQDIEAWFDGYKPHISHVVVAHTRYRPWVASQNTGRFKWVNTDTYLQSKLEATSKSTRYTLNCFNRFIFPGRTNRTRQKPSLFKPFAFVTIEGAKPTQDRQQTIHINIALGNLPTILTKEDLGIIFRHFWHEKAKQRDDVWVDNYDGRPWGGYTLKEAQQDPSRLSGEKSIWDVDNCWIPHSALSED
jgi:hypothetical protein